MKKQLFFCSILLCLFSCKQTSDKKNVQENSEVILNDGHVHIMSPDLIKDWKALGIPFSKSEAKYADLDTILKTNHAEHINLIGMGYVYGNSEFYQGDDEYEKVKQENNFLFESAKNYSNVQPYFAIDPLKEYALEELERCLKLNSNSGLKLHFSSSQVYLTEPEHLIKVKAIFKKAAEQQLPILLHFDNWHPKFGGPDVQLMAKEILSDIAPLQLTIAHFGSSGGFNQKTKNVLDAFIEGFENGSIPSKHSIRFDISAVALDKDSEGVKKLTEDEFKELKTYCDKLGYDKISFGTDYPLYTSKEYVEILKNKLQLTESELKEIMQ